MKMQVIRDFNVLMTALSGDRVRGEFVLITENDKIN